MVTKGQKVCDSRSGRLICADVIGGRGSSLRMATVFDSNPLITIVLNIKGHPRSSEDDAPSFTVTSLLLYLANIDSSNRLRGCAQFKRQSSIPFLMLNSVQMHLEIA